MINSSKNSALVKSRFRIGAHQPQMSRHKTIICPKLLFVQFFPEKCMKTHQSPHNSDWFVNGFSMIVYENYFRCPFNIKFWLNKNKFSQMTFIKLFATQSELRGLLALCGWHLVSQFQNSMRVSCVKRSWLFAIKF